MGSGEGKEELELLGTRKGRYCKTGLQRVSSLLSRVDRGDHGKWF